MALVPGSLRVVRYGVEIRVPKTEVAVGELVVCGADELEVWGTLIEAYEREHHPITPPTPLEAIEFAMDQKGLRRQDLCHE